MAWTLACGWPVLTRLGSFGPLADVVAVGTPEPGTERLKVNGNMVVTTPVEDRVHLGAAAEHHLRVLVRQRQLVE